MNEIIKTIAENGFSEQTRMICIMGGSICLITCAFWYGHKMGLSIRKIIAVLIIAYPCLLGLMEMTHIIAKYCAENHFLGIDTAWQSGVKMYVFLPLMSWVISKVLKIQRELISDLLAVIRLIEYPLSSLGCVFTGCCTGYECEWGLYNPYTNTYDFPTQPLNAVIMIMIVIWLIKRAKKNHYIPDGKQMPLMLIAMGSTRFLTEFLMDNEKLIFETSIVGLYGVAMCIMGVFILKRKNNKV